MFALSIRAEPLRKKKKVDPKKDQAARDRLKKRIRRLVCKIAYKVSQLNLGRCFSVFQHSLRGILMYL